MSKKSDFTRVEPRADLPAMERGILDLWDRIGAFKTQVEMRPVEKDYVFYDGPPFANGSPHYGHILAGVIKDVVPRFWAMKGFRVERRFGWDTHGLPIEMEVEKQLGISGPKQIAEYGIGAFNEACRALVENTADEWEHLVRRMGRWVDMDDDYKTMDTDFMESVWWVFKQLWDKGLIYEDFKVLPYSWGATTPLSNFEANLDYRDTDDPSITVSLEVLDGAGAVQAGDRLLIWTTTPWTLPGNLAIAVGTELEYVRIDDADGRFWLAADRVGTYWKETPEAAARAKGADLLGVSYRPPFDFFEGERDRGAFRVIESDTVTTEEGTGLVHMAPAYGEADFYSLQGAGIDVLVDPVDAEGKFTEEVPPVTGMNIKEADHTLIGLLKDQGILVRNERIRHSYPFCYRTGTPLIYKVIPTWFVKVSDHTDRLVETNDEIHWVPEYVGSRRFGNWLEGARDWAVSRNRYWGSCIPVWRCDSCEHAECIGSIDELYERSGVRLDDLHSHFVDPVTFPCPDCGGTMTRIPEVLDCWFESGSMPYAQIHYPFENQDRFARAFPAEFIAEGLDQTRGWFYTLHVLSTLLYDAPSFKNCVVNGMILAEDGRKMSKSLKNYADPASIFESSGADALRAFLINSPVLRAEPLRFTEEGVRHVVRTVLLPLWNTFSFFTTYAEADGITLADLVSAPPVAERPEMDRWIISGLQSLVAAVNEQMEGYYLYNVIPPTLGFIDDLTNWYVRRSRRRFWAARTAADEADKLAAFATLYEVLATFSAVLAPVLPFITERLYQTLVAERDPSAPASVHHLDFPTADVSVIDTDLEAAMRTVREVVALGHALRSKHELKVRQPLRTATVLTHDTAVKAAVASHWELVADELNVLSVDVASDETGLVELSCKADFKKLGPQLGPRMKEVAAEIAALPSDDVGRLLDGATIDVGGMSITAADVLVQRVAREGVVVEAAGGLAVALDTTLDEDLVVLGMAREVISRVQGMRRQKDLAVTDRISLTWQSDDAAVVAAFARHGDVIAGETLASTVTRGPVEAAPDTELDLRLQVERS
ncbi:MAG TPA: isoleucine--tRNA ligase [Acidimicrobiia bacterium]|nr:isoleucine--tRNA ligase [Acidimicrobiia bacterium]